MTVTLVTGTSTGIGEATAIHLSRLGHTVYASMRTPDASGGGLRRLAEEERLDLTLIALDVNDPVSVTSAVEGVIERSGQIDVLVNNAGLGMLTSVEEVPVEDAKGVFETNVFGLLRVTRATAPQMRSQASGTIINIGSLAGKVTAPFGGIYSASKHAVEALSDALYYELHPFGVRVVLIEPGGFETEIQNNVRPARRFTEGSAYLESESRFAKASEKLPGAGESADAQIVANVIVDAAKAEDPKRRYLVGQDAELIGGMVKQLSDEDFEKAMRTTLDFWD